MIRKLTNVSDAPDTVAAQDLAQEWASLIANRDNARARMERERIRHLNWPAEDPKTRENRERKRQLEARLRELHQKRKDIADESKMYERLIERRRRGERDSTTAMEIEQRVRRCRDRLARLKRYPAPDTIIQNEERMIWDLTTSVAELEERRQPHEERCAQELRGCEASIRTLEEELSSVEAEYRSLRQQVKDDLAAAEKELADAHHAFLEWACRDRERLRWLLNQQPHRQEEVLRAYRQVHPEEKLSNVEPQAACVPDAPSSTHRRKRNKRNGTPLDIQEPAGGQPDRPWTFVLVDETLTHEHPLDCMSGSVESLRSMLSKYGLTSADPDLVLEALLRVTRLSTQQRQLLNKLAGVEPVGWKIVHAGRYRLFLDIDEDRRRIRFLIRHRRDAYTKRHWR